MCMYVCIMYHNIIMVLWITNQAHNLWYQNILVLVTMVVITSDQYQLNKYWQGSMQHIKSTSH